MKNQLAKKHIRYCKAYSKNIHFHCWSISRCPHSFLHFQGIIKNSLAINQPVFLYIHYNTNFEFRRIVFVSSLCLHKKICTSKSDLLLGCISKQTLFFSKLFFGKILNIKNSNSVFYNRFGTLRSF